MKYQLKRSDSRAGRTRSLSGWRPLAAGLGLASGDVLALERVSDPPALPILLAVRVLSRSQAQVRIPRRAPQKLALQLRVGCAGHQARQ